MTAACILVAIIAVLEALVRIDHARQGLSDYDPHALSNRYFWTYISPAILSVTGLAIGILDFNTRAVAQYNSMSKKSERAEALTRNLVHHGPFTVTWTSLHQRQLAAAAGTVAIMLMQAVKIVVAGIFVPGDILRTGSTSVDVASSFNNSFFGLPNVSDSRALATYFDSFEFNNMLLALTELDSYGLHFPNWTTSDYAIADVAFPSIPSERNAVDLQIRLPAVKSELFDCRNLSYTFLDPSDVLNSTSPLLNFTDQGCVSGIEVPKSAGYFGGEIDNCPLPSWAFGKATAEMNNSARALDMFVLGCNYSMTRYVGAGLLVQSERKAEYRTL
jgi:hypothetical protein